MGIRVVLYWVGLYQKWFSPFLGNHCRYYPTCSQYVMDIVSDQGVCKGIMAGLFRIARCNPFSKGGYDPAK